MVLNLKKNNRFKVLEIFNRKNINNNKINNSLSITLKVRKHNNNKIYFQLHRNLNN